MVNLEYVRANHVFTGEVGLSQTDGYFKKQTENDDINKYTHVLETRCLANMIINVTDYVEPVFGKTKVEGGVSN